MRTLLVPLDGSAFAESSLPTVIDIARREPARIVLAGVYEPAVRTPPYGVQNVPPIDPRFDRDAQSALSRYLETAAAKVRRAVPDRIVEVSMLTGSAASRLANRATTIQADLLVLTSHGRGGAARFWLGSVTDELVRRLETPILVLPHQPQAPRTAWPPQRVLMPVHGAPAAEAMLETVSTLIGGTDVEYVLVAVATPMHPWLDAIATDAERTRDTAEQVDIANHELQHALATCARLGLRARCVTKPDRNVAQSILTTAEEVEATMIALATHGRGPVGRVLLGSVADKVLRASPVPVLLRRLLDHDDRLIMTASSLALSEV